MTVKPEDMIRIGLSPDDADIMDEVTSGFTRVRKDAEAMSVFLQDQISPTNQYKTGFTGRVDNYLDWSRDARKDLNSLYLIPGNTVAPGTTLYNDYINDIKEARANI